jgi:putative transposase
MTHTGHSNNVQEILQLLVEHGFDGMANAMEILFNEAMKIERAQYLNAEPYQRTDDWKS